MSIAEKFVSMEYGPAPEDSKEAVAWLGRHGHRLKHFIGGGWQARMSGRGEFASVQLSSIIGSATLAYHLVPGIGPARIVRTWAGITTTVDGRSVLGPASAVPNLFLAIPGFGGYTLGPLIARLVADVVMGRKPCEDLAPYSVDRFGPQLSDGRSLA